MNNLRSLFVALAAGTGVALTAGCADTAAPISQHDNRENRSTASGGASASAGHPGPTEGPATPEPTTSSTPSDGEASALLYYDHGQIHDGDMRVDYSAEGTPTYLARTAAGWVVKEAWKHVGGQLVLVRRDGSVIDTYGFDSADSNWFDISDDGSKVALVPPTSRRVAIVDAATGDRLRTLETPRTPYRVRYSGNDLVISARRTLLWDSDTGDLTELPYLQSGRISLVIDVSTDGRMALVDDSNRVGVSACLSLYPVEPEATPRWRACDVSAYEGALSPDASLVITTVARYHRSDGGGRLPAAPTTLEVIDTSSGARLGSINPPGLLLDATWTADGDVFVNTSTDGHFRAFGLYECAIQGECEKVASSEALPALGRIG